MLLTGLTLTCHRALLGQGFLPLLAIALLVAGCAEAVTVPLGAPAHSSVHFGPSCASGLLAPSLELLPSESIDGHASCGPGPGQSLSSYAFSCHL